MIQNEGYRENRALSKSPIKSLTISLRCQAYGVFAPEEGLEPAFRPGGITATRLGLGIPVKCIVNYFQND